ncbi:MAG: type II toxin-antitoxin system VapC family toxin [Spirochaetaceae bacterium]|nr:MAG: type II toxin-antitoxin system VapC family toxin [Spirochaetaceae bacterium]
MNFLVDTHYLLWSLIEPERLDPLSRSILQNSVDTKYVSVVSFWEVSLKYALGKLHLKGTTPEELIPAARESGYQILDLGAGEAAGGHNLKPQAGHKDPFDRLLIWQCIQRGMTMLTADSRFTGYASQGLKLP